MVRLPVMQQLADTPAYTGNAMNPPPAEKLEHVVQFELTTGCQWNACTYCTMYKDQRFHQRGIGDYQKHVDKVWKILQKNDPERIPQFTRVFIGSGNALAAPIKTLRQAIDYSIAAFRKNVGTLPRRVAVYGNTMDINEQGREKLRELNCGGTCGGGCSIGKFGTKIGLGVVYWGMESGNTNVLEMAKTGYDYDDINTAIDHLQGSGIRASVMVMPGLGGHAHAEGHIDDTITVLNRLRPEFVTFIGLKVNPGSTYEKQMRTQEEEGKNKPLNDQEIAEQTAQIIQGIDFHTTIGIHGTDVHKFGINPFVLGAREVFGADDATEIAAELRDKAKITGNRHMSPADRELARILGIDVDWTGLKR